MPQLAAAVVISALVLGALGFYVTWVARDRAIREQEARDREREHQAEMMQRLQEYQNRLITGVIADLRDGHADSYKAVTEAISQVTKTLYPQQPNRAVIQEAVQAAFQGTAADTLGFDKTDYFRDFEDRMQGPREMVGALGPNDPIPGIGPEGGLPVGMDGEHNLAGEMFEEGMFNG